MKEVGLGIHVLKIVLHEDLLAMKIPAGSAACSREIVKGSDKNLFFHEVQKAFKDQTSAGQRRVGSVGGVRLWQRWGQTNPGCGDVNPTLEGMLGAEM